MEGGGRTGLSLDCPRSWGRRGGQAEERARETEAKGLQHVRAGVWGGCGPRIASLYQW